MKNRRNANIKVTKYYIKNIYICTVISNYVWCFPKILYVCHFFVSGKSSYAGMKTGKPEFVGTIPNQSVAIGRDAVFTCNVKSLGPYKVSDWRLSTIWYSHGI